MVDLAFDPGPDQRESYVQALYSLMRSSIVDQAFWPCLDAAKALNFAGYRIAFRRFLIACQSVSPAWGVYWAGHTARHDLKARQEAGELNGEDLAAFLLLVETAVGLHS